MAAGLGGYAALMGGTGLPGATYPPGTFPPAEAQVEPTRLAPAEESAYQKWKASLPSRLQYEGDYDLRGFFRKYPQFSVDDPEQHMTDEFKLPNHPTFSNESRYFSDSNKHLAGHWEGNSYIPFDPRYKKRVDE